MALLHDTLAQLLDKWTTATTTTATTGHAGGAERETYPGILIDELGQITVAHRAAYRAVVGALFVLACIGNVSTLYVNSRRKLRPFFRACLISLACSDLLSCSFSTVAYLSQFNAEYIQLWTLGSVMCTFVPFATTAAILASSLVLVAIALDRYMAIMRAMLGFWNPSLAFCAISIGGIWFASLGTAAPLFAIYELKKVYLLQLDEEQPNPDELLVTELEVVEMCISMDSDIGLYYVMLFGIIFMPCIVGFLWLNTIIARQLWVRRYHHQHHKHQHQQPENSSRIIKLLLVDTPKAGNPQLILPCSMMTAFSVALPYIEPGPAERVDTEPPALSPATAARVARHRRMVLVVLLMMAVFLCLRLPAWIFLIMRMYGSFSKPVDWMLYFIFGIMNLSSCALNPLFYTFLVETIRYLSLLKQLILALLCCRPCRQRLWADVAMPRERADHAQRCGCCGLLHITWRCSPNDAQKAEREAGQQQLCDQKQAIFTIHGENSNSSTAPIQSSD